MRFMLLRSSKDTLDRLEQSGARIGSDIYANLLRACASSHDLAQGKRIHAHMSERGQSPDRFLGNLLVEMYGKCGSIADAFTAFQSMKHKNIFSWNIMIGAYAYNGCSAEALALFQEMIRLQIEASNVTFVNLLTACSDLQDLDQGKAIHAKIIDSDFQSQAIVANAVVNMYGRCGSLNDARQAFEKISSKNVISWNCIISAYARNGESREALVFFQEMDPQGFKPNRVTFLNALDACSNLGSAALPQGKMIHSKIVEAGLESEISLSNSLVNMYSKCGSLEEAKLVFQRSSSLNLPRNVISWTAMITAYAQHGYGKQSIHLFNLMDLCGVLPDEITFISVLDACASVRALAQGREVHCQIQRFPGFDQHVVLATALVNMYGECGEVDEAREVFDKIKVRNAVSWNTMMVGYARNGRSSQALELFQAMDAKANEVSYATVLEACACLCDLKQGREIHAQAVASGFAKAGVVGSALVDLYGRCGSVREARIAFLSVALRDVVSWSGMISAYCHHGWGDEALELFSEMILDGIFPNSVTFLSVLSACGHSGLLRTARQHFVSMKVDYGICSAADHYECFIDVLGRAGKLELAEELICSMPFEPGPVVWMSLLSSAKLIGDYGSGERAAYRLNKVDPGNSAAYMVLSNMYSVHTFF